MSNKLNVLFVSIAFPPKSDSEALQVAKYFKYLVRDESLIIDVVTSTDKTLFMAIDEGLCKHANGFRQIIKLPFFENRYINFIFRKIRSSSLNFPDSKHRFYKKWKKVVRELENKPDIIYSRSFPLSSTMMAYYLQKEFQIPWVLHLSDPWTLNPIHKLGSADIWNNEMEKNCFENASIISFASQKTIEMYSNKYPGYAAKMVFSPNVYDLEDKIENDYELNEKIKVVYTGGLVGDRSPDFLFKAITELNRTCPEVIADYEFVFAGALDRKNKALFSQNMPSVKHVGLLSFNDAISLQASADMLLVIDTPFKNPTDAIFFPSKLLDYMLMQKRIIALTDKNSVTWHIVNNILGDCFMHDGTTSISRGLLKSWRAWKNLDKEYFINKEVDPKYSAECNANRLLDIFRKVSSNE